MNFKHTRDGVRFVRDIVGELMAADNNKRKPHITFAFNKVEHVDSTRVRTMNFYGGGGSRSTTYSIDEGTTCASDSWLCGLI